MDNFFGDDGDGEFHVLGVWEEVVEVKMLDVGGEAFGIGGGYYTVEEALGCGDCGCWGSEGTVEGEVISSYCEAGAVLLRLFLDVYCTAKLSTTRLKMVGRVSCFQRPGVKRTGW